MTGHAGVGFYARAIVAKRVGILAVIPVVLGLAVSLGLPVGVSTAVATAATATLTALTAIVGILWAQSGTTPADPTLAPVSLAGVPLVEATSGIPPVG